MMKAALVLCGVFATQPVIAAVALQFAGPSEETSIDVREFDSYKMPVGPYHDNNVATIVAEGVLTQRTWQVAIEDGTTLRIADNQRQRLESAGFELLYECATDECGGFDFRFSTRIAPEPAMHVDLGDFRYFAAQRLGRAVPEYLSLLVSRSANLAFVQMIHVGATQLRAPDIPVTPEVAATGAIAQMLDRDGKVVLDDLVFDTGSAQLGTGAFASLTELASYLSAQPTRRVALVGHTDTSGPLTANIALSRKRAQSVAARLILEFDVSPDQLEPEGVGYLAPRAGNLTEDGMAQNRRVEAVVIGGE